MDVDSFRGIGVSPERDPCDSRASQRDRVLFLTAVRAEDSFFLTDLSQIYDLHSSYLQECVSTETSGVSYQKPLESKYRT